MDPLRLVDPFPSLAVLNLIAIIWFMVYYGSLGVVWHGSERYLKRQYRNFILDTSKSI